MICRLCLSEMTLDALVANDARRALDPGQPVPVVMRCENAHSVRLQAGDEGKPPATFRGTPQCAVCGVEIPRQKGSAPRKSCSEEHRRFIESKRAAAQAEHVRLHKTWQPDAPFVPFRFIVEAQPWYRGAATAFQTPASRGELVVPTGPDFPEIPVAWLEGFRRCYPEEATPRWFNPRHYRRRRPRPDLTPEQLMPYPVREA